MKLYEKWQGSAMNSQFPASPNSWLAIISLAKILSLHVVTSNDRTYCSVTTFTMRLGTRHIHPFTP